MTPAEGAAHRLALAVDDHERAGGFTPMLIRIALAEWREAQDAELVALASALRRADYRRRGSEATSGEVDV